MKPPKAISIPRFTFVSDNDFAPLLLERGHAAPNSSAGRQRRKSAIITPPECRQDRVGFALIALDAATPDARRDQSDKTKRTQAVDMVDGVRTSFQLTRCARTPEAP